MRAIASLLALAAVALPLAAHAGETPSPKTAKVFFVNLKNGAKVTSPVKVVMGVKGMEIVPPAPTSPMPGISIS